jgi:iron-sulfur cluster assembly protein
VITITEKAKNKLLDIKKESNYDDTFFVRVGVEGRGCSGMSYKLDFDDTINPDDKSFEDKGIKIVIDKKSFLYIIGTELDFSDGLNGKGFIFINPNATRTCGCGESFSV